MAVIIQNALSRESILGRADLCPDRDSSEECDCRGRCETGRCIAVGTKDLAKTYGRIRAVSGINLTVPRGSIYGFLGRNGAGKTTTIKMLLGLVRPTAGSARVLGMDARNEHVAILQRTAFVSEKKTLYPSLTPSEVVRFSRGFYPTWSDSAVEKYARL